jgi:hypothetical protein
MKKVVFSIFIDIPEERLDNPGWYENGEQIVTNKSYNTKMALLNNAPALKAKQEAYAIAVGADYKLFEYDDRYQTFFNLVANNFPEISEYDIVNFYKHRVMRDLADNYDLVCYLDFDVVPNTTEDIFDNHKVEDHFAVAHTNRAASHGKFMDANSYSYCIRNPASKYWNTHALLMEEGYDPQNDVFNTGIMAASSNIIKKLDYFGDFNTMIDKMTTVKHEEFSLYHPNIQRVFNYDNETVFSYLIKTRDIKIDYITPAWHFVVDETRKTVDMLDPNAHMYHFINKKMEWIL